MKNKTKLLRLSVNINESDLPLHRIYRELTTIENTSQSQQEIKERTRIYLLGILYQYCFDTFSKEIHSVHKESHFKTPMPIQSGIDAAQEIMSQPKTVAPAPPDLQPIASKIVTTDLPNDLKNQIKNSDIQFS
jgi:hypothetical protein